MTAGPEGVIIDPDEARRRGTLETAAGADGIVRAARRRGLTGLATAQGVFAAAAAGDSARRGGGAGEARLVAAAICCVIAVVDPALIVLGGGIGQAPGFAEAVTAELAAIAPVLPEVRVSALGTDVVVDGCLAEAAAHGLDPAHHRHDALTLTLTLSPMKRRRNFISD